MLDSSGSIELTETLFLEGKVLDACTNTLRSIFKCMYKQRPQTHSEAGRKWYVRKIKGCISISRPRWCASH